jgi:hypothetical protein
VPNFDVDAFQGEETKEIKEDRLLLLRHEEYLPAI